VKTDCLKIILLQTRNVSTDSCVEKEVEVIESSLGKSASNEDCLKAVDSPVYGATVDSVEDLMETRNLITTVSPTTEPSEEVGIVSADIGAETSCRSADIGDETSRRSADIWSKSFAATDVPAGAINEHGVEFPSVLTESSACKTEPSRTEVKCDIEVNDVKDLNSEDGDDDADVKKPDGILKDAREPQTTESACIMQGVESSNVLAVEEQNVITTDDVAASSSQDVPQACEEVSSKCCVDKNQKTDSRVSHSAFKETSAQFVDLDTTKAKADIPVAGAGVSSHGSARSHTSKTKGRSHRSGHKRSRIQAVHSGQQKVSSVCKNEEKIAPKADVDSFSDDEIEVSPVKSLELTADHSVPGCVAVSSSRMEESTDAKIADESDNLDSIIDPDTTSVNLSELAALNASANSDAGVGHGDENISSGQCADAQRKREARVSGSSVVQSAKAADHLLDELVGASLTEYSCACDDACARLPSRTVPKSGV
jgi:hypothetical protein